MTVSTQALPVLLLRAREISLAYVRPVLQDHGLTEPQWRVLHTLYFQPNLSAHHLAEQSCILSPSLSRILSRFTLEGLVLRAVSSADQRSITLKLSAKGKRLCQRVLPKLDVQYQALADEVGVAKVDQLARLLENFIAVEED